MANLVGQLGQTISKKVTGSISDFASGAKSAFVSANPAVFGPALSGLGKVLNDQRQKERKQDKEEKQRQRGFDEENQNEQRKLFTDILDKLKKQLAILEEILKALQKDKKGFGFAGFLAGLGQLFKSLLDKIKNIFEKLKGKFKGFVDDILKFFKKIPDLFKNLLRFLDDFIKSLRLKFPKVFGFFDDIAKFFKNIFDDIRKVRIPKIKESLLKVFKAIDGFFDSIRAAFTKGLDNFKKLIRFDDAIKALRALILALAIRFEVFKQTFTESTKGVFKRIDSFGRLISVSIERLFTRIISIISSAIPQSLLKVPTPAIPSPSKLPGAPAGPPDVPEAPKIVQDAEGRFRSTETGRFVSKAEAKSTGFVDDAGKVVKGLDQVSDAAKVAGAEDAMKLSRVFAGVVTNIKSFFAGFTPLIEGPLKFLSNITDVAPAIKAVAKVAGPLGVIIGIFDGVKLAMNLEKLEKIFGEGNVGTQERISGFIGGFIGSIGGLFDLLAQLMGIEIEGESIQDSMSGTIAKFTNDVLDGIKGFFLFLGTIVKSEQFQAIWSASKELMGTVLEGIKNIFTFFKDIFFSEPMQKVFSIIGDFISNSITTAVKMIGNLVDFFVGLITLDFSKVGSAAKNLVGNFLTGVGNMFVILGNVMIDGINAIIRKITPSFMTPIQLPKMDKFGEQSTSAPAPTPMPASASASSSGGGTRSSGSRSNAGGRSSGGAGYGPGANVGSMTENAKIAFDFFVAQGMTPEQAAGFVSNLQRESGANLNTRAFNAKEGAAGIAQWRGPRSAKFKQMYGKDIRDASLQEQLSYIMWELNNTESRAYGMIKSTTTASAAAAAVDKYYERSSGEHRQERMTGASMLLASYSTTPKDELGRVAAEAQKQKVVTPESLVEERRVVENNKNLSDINETSQNTQKTSEDILQSTNTGVTVQTKVVDGVSNVENQVYQQSELMQRQHQQQMQMDNYYFNERRALEERFYGTLVGKFDQLIQVGMFGRGGSAPSDRGAGGNIVNRFLGNKLNKMLGPEFGSIANELLGSYANQFIDTTLSAFLPETGAGGVNRAINAYLSGDKKGAREELIYGVTGIPTGMRTLIGSQYGFGANASTDFAKDLATIVGKPFESLFRIGETPGTLSNRLLYGPDSPGMQMASSARDLTTAATNLNKTMEPVSYSLVGPKTSGTGLTLPGSREYGTPGFGPPGTTGPVIPGTGRTYEQALANVKGFGINIASQMGGMKLAQMTGVKDPIGSMLLGTGFSGGLKYLGTTALTQGAQFTLSGITNAVAGAFKGIFDPTTLGTAIGNGLVKMASSNVLSGTSLGINLGDFGRGMANPASPLSTMGTAGTLGGLAGGALAGFNTYSMAKMLSGGYNVKGVNQIAGVLGGAASMGLLGSGAAVGAMGGGMFGSAAAALGMNPIGLAILGGAVLINRFFGRKPPRMVSAGITGTLGEGSTSLQEYRDMHQKGGKFRSDRNWTEYSALDPEQLKFYQTTVDSIFTGVREGAKVLKLNEKAIDGFTKSIKVNLMGQNADQALKTIEKAFTDFTVDMLAHAYPDLSQFKIEVDKNLLDTFNRLIEATNVVDSAFKMLRLTAEDLALTVDGKAALSIANFKYSLIDVFGGQDEFLSSIQEYYDIFTPVEQKLQDQFDARVRIFNDLMEPMRDSIKDLIGEEGFPEFGKTLDDSRKNYDDMVKKFIASNDMTIESNQITLRNLMKGGRLFMDAASINLQLAEMNKKEDVKELNAIDTIGPRMGEAMAGEILSGPIQDTIESIETLAYGVSDLSDSLSDALEIEDGTGSGTKGYLSEVQKLGTQGSADGLGGMSNTNVIDNSVKQVSQPRTTVMMQDDRVRDYHPILSIFERNTLSSYVPCRR